MSSVSSDTVGSRELVAMLLTRGQTVANEVNELNEFKPSSNLDFPVDAPKYRIINLTTGTRSENYSFN